jgi:hypothetical protein
MAADFSRTRLDPLRNFAGVEVKQGGVLLDADANELMAIVDRRLRALASDTLGRATVSSTTPDAFKITPQAGSLQIGNGRLYVDGLLADNHGLPPAGTDAAIGFDELLAEGRWPGPVDYAAQPFWPVPDALPTAGRHLVYLDVWDRELTHLEAPDLVESAVGVETSSRRQTVWQVRVLADDAGSSTTCGSADSAFPGWAALIAPSTGRLTTGTFELAASDDPCELPPTGGYRGLENQLYRVEIQDGGLPGKATFKWSRENASVGSRVTSIASATELALDTLGRDDVLRLNTGDWVEITDDRRELSQQPGELRRITVAEATRRISFTPALPAAMLPPASPPPQFPDSTWPAASHLRVRRWDQRGQVFRTGPGGTQVQVQDLDAAGSTGAITVPAAGTTLLLENGITVQFGVAGGAPGFKPGDFWVFAARTADASVEALTQAPPRGIHHHFARLAIWDVAAGTASDCRHPWPPAAGGSDCGCTVCVTPESHASGQLTLQQAVDRLQDSGGTICLHTGQYTLAGPVRIVGVTSLRIHGQGPSTLLLAPAGAFSVQQSLAVAIEDLSIVSLGQRAAIGISSALGLALRELVIAVFGNTDQRGAGIALSGLVAGAQISRNLLIAPDGIRALDTAAAEGSADFLITAGLDIADNVLACSGSGVTLAGPVAHLGATHIGGNQLTGCRNGALALLGAALPGAAVRIADNTLTVNGPGIACGVDGAWIESNKITATVDGETQAIGSGITLLAGLDVNGSDQAQVLSNQIAGYPVAAVLVGGPCKTLLVAHNLIERCGNGIVMNDAASAASLAIEHNQLSDIGVGADLGALTKAQLDAGIIGIGLQQANTARVIGNTLRRTGQSPPAAAQSLAGIAAFGVASLRVRGNELIDLGPVADVAYPVVGIQLLAPYTQAEVTDNHVERETAYLDAPSRTRWSALQVGAAPGNNAAGTAGAAVAGDAPLAFGAAGAVSRGQRFSVVQVDTTRALLIAGKRATVYTAAARIGDNNATLAGTAAAVAQGSSATVLGNVLISRGAAPTAALAASGDLLFNDNRCELRGTDFKVAVHLSAPVVLAHANRVRGGRPSIVVDGGDTVRVAALGNITSGGISAPLAPEMLPLNLAA